MGWQRIGTAPRDGSTIRVRRMFAGRMLFDGYAAWRTVSFPAIEPDVFGRDNGFEGFEATGWMYPPGECDKRVPEPTHWQSES